MNSKLAKALRQSLKQFSRVENPEHASEYSRNEHYRIDNDGTRVLASVTAILTPTSPRGLYSRTKKRIQAARDRSRGAVALRQRSKARRREGGRPAWGNSILSASAQGSGTRIGTRSAEVQLEGMGKRAGWRDALRRSIDATLAARAEGEG